MSRVYVKGKGWFEDGFLVERERRDNGGSSSDVTNYEHNKDVGLRRWRGTLSRALSQSGKANVNFLADSIGEGTGSTNHYTKGLAALLRAHFTSAPFNDTGVGFVPAHYSTSSGTHWMTLVGAWADDGTYGVCKRAKKSSTINDTITFTFVGSSVDINFVQRTGGGSFTVSIDGAAAVTQSTNGTTAFGKKNIGGLTLGSHTAVITVATAGGVTITGYTPFVGATYGIQFNTLAKFGSVASDHAAGTAIGAELDIWAPQLTIIALMANDSNAQTGLAFYKAQMQILISKAKTWGDVLLVSNGLRDITPSPAIPQSAYNQVLHDLAYENDCAFIDGFNAWGGDKGYAWHVANMNLINDVPGDRVHPVDAGHYDLYKRIVRILDCDK